MTSPGSKAFEVWNTLNGLLCLYKPCGKSTKLLKSDIQKITFLGLKKMGEEPPREIIRVNSSYGKPVYVTDIDYSDHPLIIGHRYLKHDVKVRHANYSGLHTSGVSVFGVNKGVRLAKQMQQSKPLSVYHVSGQLGISTTTYFTDGKVVEKATYRHVHRPIIDRVAASMQATYQRTMFVQSGVPLQSQAAYDLAVGGLIRPGNNDVPTVYGIKCIQYEPPHFTLEVTCINETELFLMTLIHEIGFKCRTVATCSKVRCIRYGPFHVKHALLRHHWNVEEFAQNIEECNALEKLDRCSRRRESAHFLPLDVDSDVQMESDYASPAVHVGKQCSGDMSHLKINDLQSSSMLTAFNGDRSESARKLVASIADEESCSNR